MRMINYLNMIKIFQKKQVEIREEMFVVPFNSDNSVVITITVSMQAIHALHKFLLAKSGCSFDYSNNFSIETGENRDNKITRGDSNISFNIDENITASIFNTIDVTYNSKDYTIDKFDIDGAIVSKKFDWEVYKKDRGLNESVILNFFVDKQLANYIKPI